MADQIEYTREDITEIGKAQRSLMQALCAILVINIIFFFVGEGVGFLVAQAVRSGVSHRPQVTGPLAILAMFLLEMCIAGLYTLRLDTVLKTQRAWAFIHAVLAGSLALPLVGLVVMAIVSSRATKVLRKRGYRVGLMGVSKADLGV